MLICRDFLIERICVLSKAEVCPGQHNLAR